MKYLFLDLISTQSDYVELRYHKRYRKAIVAENGRVDTADQSVISGVGVRVLVDQRWGLRLAILRRAEFQLPSKVQGGVAESWRQKLEEVAAVWREADWQLVTLKAREPGSNKS